MTGYRYAGRTLDGVPVTGDVEAPDQKQAVEELNARGIYPTRLHKLRLLGEARNQVLSARQASEFAGALARFLRAGIPLLVGLDTLLASAPKRLCAPLMRVRSSLASGLPLSEAISVFTGEHASTLAAMVKAGERSSQLAEVLDQAASSFSDAADLNGRLLNALIYPCIVSLMTIVVAGIFIFGVLPELRPMLELSAEPYRSPLPIVGFIDLAQKAAPIAATLISGFAAWLIFTRSGRALGKLLLDGVALSPLGLGIAQASSYGRFASLLGLCLKVGVPAPMAWSLAASAVRFVQLRKGFAHALTRLEAGAQLSSLVGCLKDVPNLLVQLTSTGQVSGQLPDALIQAGALLRQDAARRAERLASLVTPIVTILVGGLIALLVLSVFGALTAISASVL